MAAESIPNVVKGDGDYTMMHTDLANRVIDASNASLFIQFLPRGIARVEPGAGGTGTQVVFETVDLIACDADGNQFTFRLVGFQIPNAPEE